MSGVPLILTADDGRERRTGTDLNGRYRITALPFGRYTLTASADAFAPVRRTNIRVEADVDTRVDFRLEIAQFSETLSVVAHRVDSTPTSPATPTTIDTGLLQHLPVNRSVPSLINLVPGINNDAAYGGTTKSNRLTVNGVDVANPGAGEVSTVLDLNWLREVQVTALGAGAEHGQTTGATIEVMLKSGSDRVSGLGEYRAARPPWTGQNAGELSTTLQNRFAPFKIIHARESSVSLGNPLVAGRLWSFIGLQFVDRETQPAGSMRSDLTEHRDFRAFARIDAAVGGLKIDGFYVPDRQNTDGWFPDGLLTTIEAAPNLRTANDVWQTRATWAPRSRTLLDLRYGGYRMLRDQDPRPPSTRSGPPARVDLLTGRTLGNTTHFRTEHVRRDMASAILRQTFDSPRIGRHEIDGGLEYERARLTDLVGYPGGMVLFEENGVVIEASAWNGVDANLGTRRATVFASDQWMATGTLSLSGGLRLDVNRGSAGGRRGVVRTTSISPRIGAAWVVPRSGGRTLARVHYGRLHDPVYTNLFFHTDPDSEADERVLQVDTKGELIEVDRHQPPFIAGITPGLKQPAVDQVTASIEHHLIGELTIEGHYIGRYFVNFIGVAADVATYQAVARRDPGPDGRAGTPDDGGPLTVFSRLPISQSLVLTNPEDAHRRYHALQLVARRRFVRGWQMQLSYTRSVLDGSVGNAFLANSGGGSELGPLGSYVNPNRLINADGPALPYHELKALGTYRLPFWGGWNLSSVFRRQSGSGWARSVFVGGLRQGVETVRVEPRGTRRMPSQLTMDLRVEKTVALGRSRAGSTAGVYLDVFNVTNTGVATGIFATSGPLFGQPTAWTDPRTVLLGVRATF